MELDMVVHNGGCHCRRVRWRVQAPSNVVVWKCNCSDCSMRGNINFIVPSEKFELLGDSKEFLTTYTFGTHTAKHTFCKVCGITSFYFPRSNPDGVAVTYRCVDPGTLTHVEIKKYDGRNWEAHTISQALLHALKLLNEGAFFLPPLSSASLLKEKLSNILALPYTVNRLYNFTSCAL